MRSTDEERIYQNVPTSLGIYGVGKAYGQKQVLRDVSLEVEAGEFVCLLGPSGCGKTTLLRIVAGLERQDTGRLRMGERDVSHAPPQDRDYGILFQSYALFPNLTIEENVAYGLDRRQVLKSEASRRVAEMLEIVRLKQDPRAYPERLSGGQQQRVAMARALAPSPSVLLLDEPMSALDAKVRESLRAELRQLQRKLGITTVMVTHDQHEAMVMADRIAVMNEGRIEQFDAPSGIYHAPATDFVADFIGHGNWIACRGIEQGVARVGDSGLLVPGLPDAGPCRLFFRPELVKINSGVDAGLPGRVKDTLFLGGRYRVDLSLDGFPGVAVTAEVHGGGAAPAVGDAVWVTLPTDRLRVFPEAGV